MTGTARRAAVALGVSILLTACGGAPDADAPATGAPGASSTAEPATTGVPGTPTTIRPTAFPLAVVDDRGESVTIASNERIIPLDGDVAEIVFALGLGDHVVATDLSATYPPAADALPQIGYQRALNAEPILEFDPTVVIGTDLAGPPEALDALERVGVPVVIVPSAATPTGPAEKISAVAEALGVAAVGDDLAAQVQQEIDAATVAPDEREDAPRVVALYLRGDNVQLVLGEGSGIDWLIEAAGGVDVADELGIVDNAPITAEALVAAAPDVIVVPASGLDSVGGVDGLLEVPGIAETPAGAGQAVLAYDAQLMLGNGPRTGAFLTQLVADLSAATTAE